jgi:FKBP-type peptidyl-prolyl cis-trans isomerase FklB
MDAKSGLVVTLVIIRLPRLKHPGNNFAPGFCHVPTRCAKVPNSDAKMLDNHPIIKGAAMKLRVKLWMFALAMVTLLTVAAAAQDAPALKTQVEKRSYAMGLDLGRNIRKESLEVDPAFFTQGLKDALAGNKPLMTDEEVRATIVDLQNEMRAKMVQAMKDSAEKNKREGEAFLAENKKKEGVVTLPSGLQYKILKAGDGKKPTAEDTVVCQYRGTLIDGKEFDSSYKRNQPATFPVNRVIKGWTEALQLMPVGSKWQLFIPADLAYGERGAGSDIPPNSTLIFEVELVSIQPKA